MYMIHDKKALKYSLWIPVCLCRVVYLMKQDLLATQNDKLLNLVPFCITCTCTALHNTHLPSWMVCHQAHRWNPECDVMVVWMYKHFTSVHSGIGCVFWGWGVLQCVTLDSLTFRGGWIAKMSVLKSRKYFQCVLKFHGLTIQSASFLLLSCP